MGCLIGQALVVLRRSGEANANALPEPGCNQEIAMVRINIEWQDQFGRWQRFQTKHNEADAFRTAQSRARSTGKRHRLTDENGRLLDVIEP